jgi:hypothetical protein
MKGLLPLCLAVALASSANGAPSGPPPTLFLSPSGEPFRAAPGARDPFGAWFDQADANHDGAIDRAEFRADAAQFFKRLDTNGDGVIDGFELAAYEAKIVPELGEEAEGLFLADRPEHGRRHHGGHGDGTGEAKLTIEQLLDEPEPVSAADFASNSRITFAEWMTATDERFDLLDKGGTGRLAGAALKARLGAPAKAGRGPRVAPPDPEGTSDAPPQRFVP